MESTQDQFEFAYSKRLRQKAAMALGHGLLSFQTFQF